VAAANRCRTPIANVDGLTAEALGKSSTVGIDVVEMQYASAKFVFTEVECLKMFCLFEPLLTIFLSPLLCIVVDSCA
jgi:hypothetical protein